MCPGPESCPHFLAAAQDSPDEEENERNRDAACDALGTQCSRRNRVDQGLVGLIAQVEKHVRELRMGLKVEEGELKPWVREAIAWWGEIEESFKRIDARRMRDLHELLMARAEKGL
jgi:hypothetical protein